MQAVTNVLTNALMIVLTNVLIGFPTESVEEALKTVRFVIAYHDLIQSIGLSLFNLDSDFQVMLELDRYDVKPVLNPEEDLASAYDYVIDGISREEKRGLYNEITQVLESVFSYHILSLHRFLFTLPEADPDILACTVDQGLEKYARIKHRNMRVEFAYRRLAEWENQIEKGEIHYGG